MDMCQPWGHMPPLFRAAATPSTPTSDDIPAEVLIPCCKGGATPVNAKARLPPEYRNLLLETIREKLQSLVGRFVEEIPSGDSHPVYYPMMASKLATTETSQSVLPQLEGAKWSDSEDGPHVISSHHNTGAGLYESKSSESSAVSVAVNATIATKNHGSEAAREILPYMNTHSNGQTAQNKKEVEKVAQPGAYSAKNLVILDLDNMAHKVDVYNEIKCREPDHWEIISVCGSAYSGPALGTVIRSSEGVKDEADSWTAYILFTRAERRELNGRNIHLVSRDNTFRAFKVVLEALPDEQRPKEVFFIANIS